MTNPTITVVGSLNYDVVTTVNRIPNAGETIPAQGFATHNGGKGANQALACARLRTTNSPNKPTVQMVGCVGDDVFGENLKKALLHAGADVSTVRTVTELKDGEKVGTGVATILVDAATGQNRIMVYPGANALVTKDDVFNAIYNQDKTEFTTDTLVLQNEIPVSLVQDIIKDVQRARESDGSKKTPFIVYNPSPIDPSFDSALYKNIDCLIVNSTEARAIVPKSVADVLVEDDNVDEADRAAVPIFEVLNLPKYLIITLGAAGCLYLDGTNRDKPAIYVPTAKPPGPVIDTTGAGDTFLGAVAAQLTEGKELHEAVNVALVASSVAVTRRGAGDGIPEYGQLDL